MGAWLHHISISMHIHREASAATSSGLWLPKSRRVKSHGAGVRFPSQKSASPVGYCFFKECGTPKLAVGQKWLARNVRNVNELKPAVNVLAEFCPTTFARCPTPKVFRRGFRAFTLHTKQGNKSISKSTGLQTCKGLPETLPENSTHQTRAPRSFQPASRHHSVEGLHGALVGAVPACAEGFGLGVSRRKKTTCCFGGYLWAFVLFRHLPIWLCLF